MKLVQILAMNFVDEIFQLSKRACHYPFAFEATHEGIPNSLIVGEELSNIMNFLRNPTTIKVDQEAFQMIEHFLVSSQMMQQLVGTLP